MAKFAKYSLSPTQAAEWLAEHVSKLQTQTCQAFDYFGALRESGTEHHTKEMRTLIADVRELSDILERNLDDATAPQTEEVA